MVTMGTVRNATVGALAVMAMTVTMCQPLMAEQALQISGSVVMHPLARIVADAYTAQSGRPQPIIEPIGTTNALARLCSNERSGAIDIATASRQIFAEERSKCRSKMDDVVEIKLGHDGIVIVANSNHPLSTLSIGQLYRALGKRVPDRTGSQRVNPYDNWSQVDASLPNTPIAIVGPSSTSGTYGALSELVFEAACSQVPSLQRLKDSTRYVDKLNYQANCVLFRQDDNYQVVDRFATVVERVVGSEVAIGIVPFTVYQANATRLKALSVNDVTPSLASIASQRYPLIQSLYLYTLTRYFESNAAVRTFIDVATQDGVWGIDGSLASQGMVPLSRDEQRGIVAVIEAIQAAAL